MVRGAAGVGEQATAAGLVGAWRRLEAGAEFGSMIRIVVEVLPWRYYPAGRHAVAGFDLITFF
ncbi:hypothetical protein GCM10020218_093740 [Dactylosporangium vinaceum]